MRMNYVAFDIETQNTFEDTGKSDPVYLDVSVACLYDSRTDSFVAATIDNLDTLWPYFEKTDMIVGYNSNHFDIPILNKYYPGNLAALKSIDLLESIKNSLGKRLRMDSVAEATLGEKKSGHGLQAIYWWKSGEIDKIKKYCLQDVKITKELFEYALKNKTLKYKDGLKKREIPINTETWENGEHAALTHSLPF